MARITGIGIDILEVDRLRDFPDREGFLREILREGEVSPPYVHMGGEAAIITLKESLLKALGWGLHKGFFWHDIETRGEAHPVLHGAVKQLAAEKAVTGVHLSQSHTQRYALSMVILEGG
jgi:holo-[acyl-carrier-protein] synthase